MMVYNGQASLGNARAEDTSVIVLQDRYHSPGIANIFFVTA